MSYQYSPEALIAAHEAFRDLLDAATDPASIRIVDEDDILLAEIPLERPSGTVDPVTGQLALHTDGREESAPESGYAHECQVCDGDGVAHLTMPCVEGVAAVPGAAVLNTLNIIEGAPVEAILPTIG